MHDIAAAWIIGGFLLFRQGSNCASFLGMIIIIIATLIGSVDHETFTQTTIAVTPSLP